MKKYKKGLVFGVFDLFHIGHLNLIKGAKAKCKHLTVCVNEDFFVRTYKQRYPVIPLRQRLRIIMALKDVDDIRVQSCVVGKKQIIEDVKPDVIFAGSCYNKDNFGGEGYGVECVYLPYTSGISTSKIIKRIKDNDRFSRPK